MKFIFKHLNIDPDLLAGIGKWRIWVTLGAVDIKQRYRRSIIGPFWATISLGVTIAGIGFVFSTLFRIKLEFLMPYLCSGMILWTLITGIVADGCQVFAVNGGIIKSINLPISIHVFRLLVRQFILFFHNILIFFIVMVLFSVEVKWTTFLVIPGLILYFLNGVWISLILGLLSARFRDIPQIVQNFMQLAFFVTPIFWTPDILGSKRYIANGNIFLHYLDIVRLPLIGQTPIATSWYVVMVTTIIGFSIALPFFVKYRKRSVGWL